MPRDGSLIPSDVRGPTLAIVCEPCGRRGRYNVGRLIAEHGDAKLTNLRGTLADCPKVECAPAGGQDQAAVLTVCRGRARRNRRLWAALFASRL